MRREIRALAAFAALGWRGAMAQTAGIVARGGLYALVLAIFWQLWQATPLGELVRSDLTPSQQRRVGAAMRRLST